MNSRKEVYIWKTCCFLLVAYILIYVYTPQNQADIDVGYLQNHGTRNYTVRQNPKQTDNFKEEEHEIVKPVPHTVAPPVESTGVCDMDNANYGKDTYGCRSTDKVPDLKCGCHLAISIDCQQSLISARDKYYKHLMRDHCSCRSSKYFGRQGDGGWGVCMAGPFELKKNNCLIYSVGIRDDWSFDDAVSKQYGCDVMAFDPSIGKGDHKHSDKVWFYSIGLGGKDEEKNQNGWKMKTLKSMIAYLGHQNRTIDMVKFDIEFSEFAAIAAMLQDGVLQQVRQIALEVHTWRDTVQDYVYFWRQLQGLENAGFQRWRHQHLNWRCFKSKVGKKETRYCPQVNMNFINTNFITS